MLLFNLVRSNLTTRKVRTGLTVAAIALSVSLVVAVTSGYRSAEAAVYQYLITFMGSTDLQIAHKNDFRQGVDQALIAQLRADPEVYSAFGRLETDTGMIDKAGKGVPGASAQLIGLDRPADLDITRTPIEAGAWFDTSSGDVAVIDQAAAQTLKLKVGDTFELPGVNGKRRLTVVGICHKPAILAEDVAWIYLPLQTCQELVNRPGQVTRVMINLNRGVDDTAFAARWQARAQAVNPDLKVRLARDTRKDMDQQLAGVHFLSYMGSAISMIVAAFIVFTALSMGVAERQRTLAMLRAIGAFRGQVARMVVMEGALLGTIGAVIGAPLGILWVVLSATWRKDFFSAGVVFDWPGVGLGILAATVSALAAGIVPAWSASRVSPLEAMTPLARRTTMRGPLWFALLGVALISIDPFFIFVAHIPPNALFYEHFFLGLPAAFVGFFLLAPLVVWSAEKLLGRLIPRMLGVQPSLLRQQLTGGIWRAAGTGSALMMGLAILVVLHTVGHSMLSGWRLPDRFPDVFIYTGEGLTREQWQTLDKTPGIKPGEVMAMTIAFPGMPDGLGGVMIAAVIPDATMFIGVEPDQALRMMDLEFREGTAKDAAAALKKGDHIIITEEFHVLKGLKVGDKMALMTRVGRKEFTICGVVWSPGIDVMVQMFDMGKMFEQRTAASVFGSIDDANRYFGKDKAFLFAANLEEGVADKTALLKSVKEHLGEKGWKAGDVRKIKREILKGFERLLLLLSTMAFAAMAVAALGVTNTVMASVRSRQWQFGILRSIGVTRGQLLRLIFAESLLLGIVGCALGLAAGLLLAFNATGLSRQWIGYVWVLNPPWGMIALGTAIIMCVSLLASLWPAIHAARSEPLTLLQSGRAAV